MTRLNHDAQAEDMAAAWLRKNGLDAVRFSKHEKRKEGVKTPDFRVFFDDHLVAYCEVKSLPPNTWLYAEQLANCEPSRVVKDSAFNRISKDIEEAAKQFDSVNQDREVPSILVFVNWADGIRWCDLEETFTGYLKTTGWSTPDFVKRQRSSQPIPTMPKIAEGRSIRERKHRIDLFVWIDGKTKQEPELLFPRENASFRDRLCELFGTDHIRE